jgi:hypothetical protein
MAKTYKLHVDGKPRTAVEAYSSGPGTPIREYVLTGGDRLVKIGDAWTLQTSRSAFWEPRPTVTVVEAGR